MIPKNLLAWIGPVLACCAGCGAWDHASVKITYVIESQPQAWHQGKSARQRIENAFKEFSAKNGYECRPHIKRVEEISCSGPGGLHLTFRPTHNKPEFVAEFSWVELSGRSEADFRSLVAEFQEQIRVAVADAEVEIFDNG